MDKTLRENEEFKIIDCEKGTLDISIYRTYQYEGEIGRIKQALLIICAFPQKAIKKLGKDFEKLTDEEKHKRMANAQPTIIDIKEHTLAVDILTETDVDYSRVIPRNVSENVADKTYVANKSITSVIDQLLGVIEPKTVKMTMLANEIKAKIERIVGKPKNNAVTF